MSSPKFIPLSDYRELPDDEIKRRAASFHEQMRRRRTVSPTGSRLSSQDAMVPDIKRKGLEDVCSFV